MEMCPRDLERKGEACVHLNIKPWYRGKKQGARTKGHFDELSSGQKGEDAPFRKTPFRAVYLKIEIPKPESRKDNISVISP